jgi:hypothetical protein
MISHNLASLGEIKRVSSVVCQRSLPCCTSCCVSRVWPLVCPKAPHNLSQRGNHACTCTPHKPGPSELRVPLLCALPHYTCPPSGPPFSLPQTPFAYIYVANTRLLSPWPLPPQKLVLSLPGPSPSLSALDEIHPCVATSGAVQYMRLGFLLPPLPSRPSPPSLDKASLCEALPFLPLSPISRVCP